MPTLTPISSNGTTEQLKSAIEKAFPKAVAQPESKELAKKLRGQNDYDTSRNIFNWVLTNIRYVKDGSHQVVKLPSALLVVKQGDCKSMALLTASLLANNGIVPKFVYTSYKRYDKTPTHVYIETDSGIILDPVWKRFNSEKIPTYKTKKSMNISYLSGVDGCESCSLGAINLKKPIAKGKEVVKKVGGGAKVVGLSAGRLLFLTMIKNNLDGIASKLSRGNQAKQIALWKKAGGDATKFASAIKTGSQKPAKKLGFLGKLKYRLSKKKVNGVFGIGETDDDALKNGIRAIAIPTGALVGSSAPAVGTAVGTGAGASLGEVLIIILPMVQELVAQTPVTDATPENAPFNQTGQLESETPEGESSSANVEEKSASAEGRKMFYPLLTYAVVGVAGYFIYKKFIK
jgi:hypothetical protein